MADEPVSAWREPLARRARRWARRNRTAVTGAGGRGAGRRWSALAAVLAVQTQANGRLKQANIDLAIANDRVTKANAELKSANEREKQRFDLAMEAIKLFHGEVGDDLVLKADQFKPLRDKLLKGAADFYGKLEGLLKDQTDRASRAAMGNAYFELGELTVEDRRQGRRRWRPTARGWRSVGSWPRSPPPTPRPAVDVARSLHAAANPACRDRQFGRGPRPL